MSVRVDEVFDLDLGAFAWWLWGWRAGYLPPKFLAATSERLVVIRSILVGALIPPPPLVLEAAVVLKLNLRRS